MIALLLATALGCEGPTTAAALLEAEGRAEVAFAALDADAFAVALTETRDDLTCLGEPLGVDGAAAVHRVEALAAFLADDSDAARAHFAAVRALLPAWRLPTGMAPEGHPLRAVFDAAEPDPTTLTRPRADGVAWVEVDGRRTDEVPATRPYVLQEFARDGAVRSTGLATGAPPAPPVPPAARRRVAGRWIGAAVLGGLAAGAFAGSAVEYDKYWDPSTSPATLPGHRTATNALTGVGIGATAGAAGMVTWAALSGRF